MLPAAELVLPHEAERKKDRGRERRGERGKPKRERREGRKGAARWWQRRGGQCSWLLREEVSREGGGCKRERVKGGNVSKNEWPF